MAEIGKFFGVLCDVSQKILEDRSTISTVLLFQLCGIE